MIPREKLFGNPLRTSPRISPDGEFLAFRAPHDGVLNVWVAPRGRLDLAQPITHDRTTGISQYFWAHDHRHLLFLQDENGNEDYHLFAVDRGGGPVRDLTPLAGITAQVIAMSPQHPNEILVGINDRDEHYYHDVYRIDLASGQRQLLIENPGFLGFVADHDHRIRLALALNADSELDVLLADPATDEGWRPLLRFAAVDLLTSAPVGFDASGEILYLIDSRDRDTAACKQLDLCSGELREVFANDRADIDSLLQHPTRHHVQAVSFNYERPDWEVLDPDLRADFEKLRRWERGDFNITSRSQDDRYWTVSYDADNAPIKFFLYDRHSGDPQFLFSHRPELEQLPLAEMRPVVIPARDGLPLVSYLTLPRERASGAAKTPTQPLPLVLLVHGGPWARDSWGFDPVHQLLANRGYAVLSVNFRGSTGFGKRFINAADREWAQAMHTDLLDAVEWAVRHRVAAADKIAIMGGSYGGYAVLVGLAFTPETFACGVDIVGPSNLISLMENPPPYWMPMLPLMKTRIGDWTSDEGRAFLESRSPLGRAAEIRRPLLIGQGAQDPRVKQAESDQIVAAMQAQNIPVTYLLFPEEGHGFDRPENNLAFFAVTEQFLARHLGGTAEPLGTTLQNAHFEVPAGAEQIPGLAAQQPANAAN